MTLIKSISGIRGTIGGPAGSGLTPFDIVKYTCAYCKMLRVRRPHEGRYKVVVGKDARISGKMVEELVCGTISACGIDVIKAGKASTPTTEMAVVFSGADGGIILTASHNPKEWNALKLLNEKGEFLTAEEGQAILDCAEKGDFNFATVDQLGKTERRDFTPDHIAAVLALPQVDTEAVRNAGFTVVLDAINSVGNIIMPKLLQLMGVRCIKINGEPNGNFAHNPEPLPKNLKGLSDAVKKYKADLGISVDPDVDRLAFICENGEPFVEEYTLVSVADYILSLAEAQGLKNLCTVSNLSSSRALRDVTEAHGGTYYASAVGEVNVTTKMHQVGALIGGEGNGGVIFPALHSGRDAMVGTALFLSNLAHKKMTASEYKATLPQYHISKNRIDLDRPELVDVILEEIKKKFADEKINTVDGVRIDFESRKQWVHLRKSNTEPIIRVYAEARTEEQADALAGQIVSIAKDILNV